MPVYPFSGEGFPTKTDYRKKGTLILTSLLEDLVTVVCPAPTDIVRPEVHLCLFLRRRRRDLTGGRRVCSKQMDPFASWGRVLF